MTRTTSYTDRNGVKHYGAQARFVKEWEMEANARLIAAAPDLLAALKYVQPFIEDQQAFNATCAAIARAEGKQ